MPLPWLAFDFSKSIGKTERIAHNIDERTPLGYSLSGGGCSAAETAASSSRSGHDGSDSRRRRSHFGRARVGRDDDERRGRASWREHRIAVPVFPKQTC